MDRSGSLRVQVTDRRRVLFSEDRPVTDPSRVSPRRPIGASVQYSPRRTLVDYTLKGPSPMPTGYFWRNAGRALLLGSAVIALVGAASTAPAVASVRATLRPVDTPVGSMVTKTIPSGLPSGQTHRSGLRQASSAGRPASPPMWVVPPPSTMGHTMAATTHAANLSSNWAGYVLGNGTFSEADVNWVVPRVSPTAANTYSSAWVGVDGVGNNDLIQTGTEQDWTNGAADYYAWFEILPAPATVIDNAPVSPGDQMQADVAEQSPGTWLISIVDLNKWSFQQTVSYGGPAMTAEYILERPSSCLAGCLLPLANFATINFTTPRASVTTQPADVTAFQLAMTDDGGGVIAQSSTLGTDGSFAVSRVFPPPPWILDPGAATDISVGANGAVWVIGTNTVPGGHGIYTWTGANWAAVPGGAVKVAVGPDGSPWVINSANHIYHRSGTTWIGYPGAATDISVGANGAVWVIGTNTVPGGHGIYTWTGSAWAGVAGGAVKVAVGPDGSPWVINSANHIYHRSGTTWIGYPGAATDISVGADGAVWVIGTNTVPGGHGIYTWTGSAWAGVAGGAVDVALGPDGSRWVINSANHIYSA